MKILIFGLPGAGKTYLCNQIVEIMGDRIVHINADKMREEANDWDFSEQGRWRQYRRMLDKANEVSSRSKIALVDFVCPYKSAREQFNADLTIFMGTQVKSKYEDTNKVFEWPHWTEFDFDFVEWDEENPYTVIWALHHKMFDYQKETVQMLGRWQPWHEGHQALLDRALAKTGQVSVQIRNMPVGDNNPYSAWEVEKNLKTKLARYAGLVEITIVPNIVNITYGRKVGYIFEQEHFSKEIEDVSGTSIRAAK